MSMKQLPLLENIRLVGIHFDSVKAILELYQIRYRIARWKGQSRILTRDYVQDRYNLYVNNNGIVEDITFG